MTEFCSRRLCRILQSDEVAFLIFDISKAETWKKPVAEKSQGC